MSKIHVVQYANSLNLGGTEKTMELFTQYLDRSRYQVSVVTRLPSDHLLYRLKMRLLATLGAKRAKKRVSAWRTWFARQPNFEKLVGSSNIHIARDSKHLKEILLRLRPDILHVHYSGQSQPPLDDSVVMDTIPHVITTNVFEFQNTSPEARKIKRMLFVSQWLIDHHASWAKDDPRSQVLYNPIEKPKTTVNLRQELNIPESALVVGRIGRADPDIHDPISLNAFAKLLSENTTNEHAYFVAVAAPENMIEQAKALGLGTRFIALPENTSSNWLSQFYNSIDVLAHARKDGETFGCSIAEAMIHGKPVVSHLSGISDAHPEIMGDTGYIVKKDDVDAYAQHLKDLFNDPKLRTQLGQQAQVRAEQLFEAKAVTRKLETLYKEFFVSTL